MALEDKIKVSGPMRLPRLQNSDLTQFIAYYMKVVNEEFYALQKGEIADGALVRIQSACTLGNVFNSQRCDCKAQLDDALSLIGKEGGLLLYNLTQEGRGAGHEGHLEAYMEMDKGLDTVAAYEALNLPVDPRDYKAPAKILMEHYNFKKIRLLTNNPAKIKGLENYGLEVERIPLIPKLSQDNEFNPDVKRKKMGHLY